MSDRTSLPQPPTDLPGAVRVRVAPSPTGDPHVGTAYMALFNTAFARSAGGVFLLRIEDTDRARYQADSEQQVFDMLAWLGLSPTEGPHVGGPAGPYRQSERLASYRPFVDTLLAAGHAYHCWCTPERLAQMRTEQQQAKRATGYDRLCLGRSRDERAQLPGFSPEPVVRMKIPDDVTVEFTDLIRGQIKAPVPDDQVIVKADGFPTYHLAVVVDDHLMGITHVVRGEEWISSTPKHLLLADWLGIERPQYAHMPLLRNTDKSKISKRKNPAARLTWFVEQGYLPEALVNFLGLLGYSLPGGEEIFDLDRMTETFDWARVNTVGPVFDLDKLLWLNGHYLRALPIDVAADRILDWARRHGGPVTEEGRTTPRALTDGEDRLLRAGVPLVVERTGTLGEAARMLEFLLIDEDDFVPDPAAVTKTLVPDVLEPLDAAVAALAGLDRWATENIEATMRQVLVEQWGLKPRRAFGPVRVALTGSTVSPPLFESMELLGRDRSLARLRAAVAALRGH